MCYFLLQYNLDMYSYKVIKVRGLNSGTTLTDPEAQVSMTKRVYDGGSHSIRNIYENNCIYIFVIFMHLLANIIT